jgi:hypothetical protein
MPKIAQKATARLLIFILFTVPLMAELAHQHSAPNARLPVKNLAQQIQTELPRLRPAPSLCLACLFSSENQSLPPALTFIVNFSPVAAVAPAYFHFFSQFDNIPCRNRAPPA